MWDLSFPTKDWTYAPAIGVPEKSPRTFKLGLPFWGAILHSQQNWVKVQSSHTPCTPNLPPLLLLLTHQPVLSWPLWGCGVIFPHLCSVHMHPQASLSSWSAPASWECSGSHWWGGVCTSFFLVDSAQTLSLTWLHVFSHTEKHAMTKSHAILTT